MYGEGTGERDEVKENNAVDAAVGARIRNLRLRNRLSQTRLGEQFGVTFQQIQKYENGTNRVSAGRLAQLANFFACQSPRSIAKTREQCQGDLRERSRSSSLREET